MKTSLFRVVSLSGLLTLTRLAAGFIVSKVVAIYTGPSGVAQIGQLQSLVATLSGLVSAPLGNALVTATAEHSGDANGAVPYWRAAASISLAIFLLLAMVASVASTPLAQVLVGNSRQGWLILILVASLPLYAVHSVALSVLNGQQRYRQYVGGGLVATATGSAFTIVMVMSQGLTGALIAAVLSGAVFGLAVMLWLLREPWMQWRLWFGRCERDQLHYVFRFVIMTVVSALVVPVAQIMVRDTLIHDVSWTSAGYWQSVYKISDLYLSVAVAALSAYLLPRLATLKTHAAMRTELYTVAGRILPLVALTALGIYLTRDWLIRLLFTAAFVPARDLFAVQLVGDVVKIASWIWAYPMVARRAVKPFIVLELVSSALLVVLARELVPRWGAEGANLAYLLDYLFYLVAVVVVFWLRCRAEARGGASA